ncbi:UNVERIFIED_CONTAM: hypothetical protein HDU68_004520 [Siphonaria sp. JEL0065]|nr:hypothetical protein HDU68_004520 [Siphonaria sp. JEL0065]
MAARQGLPEYDALLPEFQPTESAIPSYEGGQEAGVPKRFKLEQFPGQTAIVVSDTDTSAPLYSIQLDDNAAPWVSMSPVAILANPPSLETFENTAPAFTTIQFGSNAVLNNFNPYRHDIRRWGYKITAPSGNYESNFPLDEGISLYAVGLFETAKTKYQWVVSEFLDLKHQTPLDPKEKRVQLRLYCTKVYTAKTDFGRFLNTFKGPAVGLGWERCGAAEITLTKDSEGVNGTVEPLNKHVFESHEEAALVAASAVAAMFAYKYRVARYRLKALKGDLF